MATKKRLSYPNILKQAISEFDTSKTVDVKGPMLDPILSWDGNGELPIYKDAASILERYYFNETADPGIEAASQEEIISQDGAESKTPSEKNAEGTGTVQAGTSDAGTMAARKDDIEAGVAKEWLSLFEEEKIEDAEDVVAKKKEGEEEEGEEAKKEKVAEQMLRLLEAEEAEEKAEEKDDKEKKDKGEKVAKKVDEVAEWVSFLEQQDHNEKKETPADEKKESDKTEKEEEDADKEVEVTESAIIEKLIEEMEAAGDALPQEKGEKEDEMDVDEKVKDDSDKKKVEEALRMIELAMDYEGDGVAPGMSAKDEKEASGPMEDTEGAGTEQAGTGDAAGQVPDRKDVADSFVDPKNYNEMQNVKGPAGKMGAEDIAELFGLFEEEMTDGDEDLDVTKLPKDAKKED
jgi:hypothetical protein